jgi:hypothetical protein
MLSIVPVIEMLGHLMSNFLSNDSLINYLNKVSFFDELILSLLLFIASELVEYAVELAKYHKQMKAIELDILNNINRNNDSIEDNNASIRKNNDDIHNIFNKFDLINTVNDLGDSIKDLKHPYFIELINERLLKIVKKVEIESPEPYPLVLSELTSPSAEQTFGVKGIRCTNKDLRFFSSFDDYWEDQSNTEYDDEQDLLIRKKKKIRRLFIDHSIYNEDDDEESKKKKDKRFEGLMKRMKNNSDRKIEARYFPATEIFTDFKNKDGLIQDSELLVLLTKTGDGKHKSSKELITMHPYAVDEAIRQFDSLWKTAKELDEAEDWRSSKCQC